MPETGCLGLVHWDDPEGWYGEGGSGWGTLCTPMEDSISPQGYQFSKTLIIGAISYLYYIEALDVISVNLVNISKHLGLHLATRKYLLNTPL